MNTHVKTIFAALLLTITLIWVSVLIPRIHKISQNFTYTAEIVSLDNFYDQTSQQYMGEDRSETEFDYKVVGVKDGNLLIKNSFNVRKITGEPIFSVERLYGINAVSGEHVVGYGDRDRYGFLFAPKNLPKGQSFTYWHVNYDGPAHMNFVREEKLFGLKVYRYATRYDDVKIDQTKNLTYLPDVGITKGIELEPQLELWIEPSTGRLIKYRDDTIAYYYDLKTGQRLYPWNHFSNSFTSESVQAQVDLAKKEKLLSILMQGFAPLLLMALVGFLGLFHYSGSIKFKRILGSILIFAILGWVAIFALRYVYPVFAPPPLEEVRIGVSKAAPELSALVYVAENQNYFEKNGLNLVQVPEESGIVAQQNTLKGVTDIATTIEFAFVSDSFNSEELKILTTISRSNFVEIIGRRDKGISSASDLKGKKIGVVAKSASEFLLGKFLTLNNISLDEVTIVNVTFDGIQEALISGMVDAVAVNDPFAYQLKTKLNINSISWSAQTDLGVYWILVSSDEYIKAHQETIEKFIKSLVQAEDFMKKNPGLGKEIVKNKLSLEQTYLDYFWTKTSFGVSLEQGLLISMEEQARWRIANKLTDKIAIPNFVEFIYSNALRQVKIHAVTLY